MDNRARTEKIQAIADKLQEMGFTKFVVLAWDGEDKWASTVSLGITKEYLQNAADFFARTAKD
jgi:hypothetical protein